MYSIWFIFLLLQGLIEYAKERIELSETLSLIHHLTDGKDKHPKFIFPSNFI